MKQEHKALTALVGALTIGVFSGVGLGVAIEQGSHQESKTCSKTLEAAQDMDAYATSASDLGRDLINQVNTLDPDASDTAVHLSRVLEHLDEATATYRDYATSCTASNERAE